MVRIAAVTGARLEDTLALAVLRGGRVDTETRGLYAGIDWCW